MALGISPQQIVKQKKYVLLNISNNWTRVQLSDIAYVQNGCAFQSKYFNKTYGLPLIRIRDISKSITENLYSGDYSEDFVVKKGDILIGMDGDFNVSKWSGTKGLLNQRVCRLIKTSNFYVKEFLYLCLQPYLNAIHQETSAVTVKHLSSRTINNIPLPLPPLPEQRAIVSKIDQLFSELDNGVKNLEQAQQKLAIYRQALLKKAFEGELTRDYSSKKSKVLNKWEEFRFEEILDIVSGKNQKKVIDPNGKYSIYGSAGKFGKATDYLCEEGTTIIGRKGTINSPIFVNEKFWNVDTAFGLSPNKDFIIPKFLYYFCKKFNFSKLDKSTTIPSLAKRDLFLIKIILPEKKVQQQIVQEIEYQFSICDALEKNITKGLHQAKSLKQSILKKAFDGKLLSENQLAACQKESDWEPASELLKKIKVEKEKQK